MKYRALLPSQRELMRVLARRLGFTIAVASVFGLFLSLPSETPAIVVIGRAWVVGLSALAAFALLQRWPRKLPDWLARWVLQLLGVVVAIPFAALLAYWLSTERNFAFLNDRQRLGGLAALIVTAIIFTPWIALGAIVRQREASARHQQSAFELERGKLEREALDARMRLLQAQVQPHFLFNTLANI